MLHPSLENPFAPKKQRKDDPLGAVRGLMGEEAAQEVAHLFPDSGTGNTTDDEPTDIVTPEELAAAAARERDRIREHTPPITATVRPSAESGGSFQEGREITLDLQEILAFSTAFLQDKAPPSWAQELREIFPHGIALTPEQRATIERAIHRGFTRAILFPGADTQGITTETTTAPDPRDPTKTTTECTLADPNLLTETTEHLLNTSTNADGDHPVPGLPDGDEDGQYETPLLGSDSLKAPSLREHAPSRTRPYLLLYRPDGILPDTMGKTFPQCDAILAQHATDWHLPTLTGFTTPEWLLTQRREVEERAPLTADQRTTTFGDPRIHAFDGYDDDATKSRWAWNLDSRVPEGCAHGSWDPRHRRSHCYGNDSSLRHEQLGARPAVVVQL